MEIGAMIFILRITTLIILFLHTYIEKLHELKFTPKKPISVTKQAM